MVEGVEAEGRTVSEATAKALAELGLGRDEVHVEVLTEGRARLLGFRGEPARVRVTPLQPAEAEEEEAEEEEGEEELPAELMKEPAAPVGGEEVETAVQVLTELLSLMQIDAEVTARAPETAGDGLGLAEAVLDVTGDDLGILIGRRGGTLAALQYVLNLIVAKKVKHRVAFGVDVDSYRRRREEALVSLAKRMASRVRGTGRSVTLEPMPPNERRIVHLALAADPSVMTVSIGEGEARKVAITPSQ